MSRIPCPLYQNSLTKHHFLKVKETPISYTEALEAVSKLEEYLLEELGLKQGDVISSFLNNTEFNIYLLVACFRTGIIYNPINYKTPVVLREKFLSIISPKVVITESVWESDYTLYSEQDFQHKLSQYTIKNTTPTKEISLNNNFLIIFSSGSISFPKAIVLSVDNIYHSLLGSQEIIAVEPKDRWSLSLPLFHISGISVVMRCLFFGATVSLMDQQTIIDDKISIVSWVPTLLKRYLDTNPDSCQLKAILLGGAPCSSQLLYKALKLNLPIYYSYGMTEMSSQIYTKKLFLENDEIKEKGFLLKYAQLKINDDDEILVKGETLSHGYIDEKTKTIQHIPLDEEGYFHTGDLGYFKNNTLTITGRRDNLFVSGGENIQAEHIEKVFWKTQENLETVFVIPKDDEEYGQIPVAFMHPFPENVERVKQELMKYLPRFMIPKEFHGIPEEILNKGFKVNRGDLKKL